uniref:Uncharacterized protein n=1 Tax=Anguilla anguilla TaxID=7936 RepID=A0A0E9WAD8_ANGAN
MMDVYFWHGMGVCFAAWYTLDTLQQ